MSVTSKKSVNMLLIDVSQLQICDEIAGDRRRYKIKKNEKAITQILFSNQNGK